MEKILVTKNELKNSHLFNKANSKAITALEKIGLLPLIEKNTSSFQHFMHILGFRYSDGCIYEQKRNNSFTYYLCFADQEDAQNFIEDTKRKWNLELKIHYGTRAYYVYLPANLGRLTIHLGSPVGNKNLQLFRVPKWIFKLSNDLKWQFISGLFSGDGSIPKLKPKGSSSESLKLSLSAEEAIVENFCKGFMNDVHRLLLGLNIKVSNPKIEWNSPHLSKKGITTYPVTIRILTKKKNMINFLEKISYKYCKRAHKRAYEVLKVLKGKRQKEILTNCLKDPKNISSPKISILLKRNIQTKLIKESIDKISTTKNHTGKCKQLATYLHKTCPSFKKLKVESLKKDYIADWKNYKKFIPIDCFIKLIELNKLNLIKNARFIIKVKYLRTHNKYAINVR